MGIQRQRSRGLSRGGVRGAIGRCRALGGFVSRVLMLGKMVKWSGRTMDIYETDVVAKRKLASIGRERFKEAEEIRGDLHRAGTLHALHFWTPLPAEHF